MRTYGSAAEEFRIEQNRKQLEKIREEDGIPHNRTEQSRAEQNRRKQKKTEQKQTEGKQRD